MQVSVIINTLNRASYLRNTLIALTKQSFKDFELVIVNGPSTDNTKEVVLEIKKELNVEIKYIEINQANLSISRNVGIINASGEIIAFIDDDGVPECSWLEELLKEYSDPMVGAVGGFLLDHTGVRYQAQYIYCDRTGLAEHSNINKINIYNLPKFWKFISLIGCNSSFRSSVLEKIGGFDEEFEYFLDETDVCARVIDSGYLIKINKMARVHHKYAPSHLRDHDKKVKYFYPIIKNIFYFSLRSKQAIPIIDSRISTYLDRLKVGLFGSDSTFLMDRSHLSQVEFAKVQKEITDGIRHGESRSNEPRKLLPRHFVRPQFCRYLNVTKETKTIIIVSADFPPHANGGIGVFSKEFAVAASREGNDVHVISKTFGSSNIDFQEGIWIHHLGNDARSLFGLDKNIVLGNELPEEQRAWASLVAEYCKHLSASRKISFTYSPIWDVEGYFLKNYLPNVNHIVWLQTNYAIALDSHSEWLREPFYSKHYKLLVDAEKELISKADYIHSISKAIEGHITSNLEVDFKIKSFNLPIGVSDLRPIDSQPISIDRNTVDILFVGRLEKRKGVFELLKACSVLWEDGLDFNLKLIGRDDLVYDGLNTTIKEWFSKNYLKFMSRVDFMGMVDAKSLIRAYNECDFFVAPSEFESFGLIFIEAFRASKPAIGFRVGGVEEIIEDKKNGLLVEKNDVDELHKAIKLLIIDKDLRMQMGRIARNTFENKFEIGRVTGALLEKIEVMSNLS